MPAACWNRIRSSSAKKPPSVWRPTMSVSATTAATRAHAGGANGVRTVAAVEAGVLARWRAASRGMRDVYHPHACPANSAEEHEPRLRALAGEPRDDRVDAGREPRALPERDELAPRRVGADD